MDRVAKRWYCKRKIGYLCRRFFRSPAFFEAHVVAIAEDHVVEELNSHELATLGHALGKLYILAAGFRVPSGVIMDEDNAASAIDDRRLEDFSRVDDWRR